MIITLSGASGTGKTAITGALMKRLPNAGPVLSVTTRDPRPTDHPGDYQYVTQDAFQAMEASGRFLWTAGVGATRYGTPRDILQAALDQPEAHGIMILVPERVVDLRAFAAENDRLDDVRSFYILSPDESILRTRMSGRGDAEEKIEERIRECRDFEARAKTLDVPFIWIEDRNDMEEKIRTVIAALRT